MIKKVSQASKDAIRRKSAYALPDRPSDQGLKPDEIKRAFYQPVVDVSNSVISEIDRLTDDINAELTALGATDDDAQQQLDEEIERAEGAEAQLQANIDAETERAEGVEGGLQSQIDEIVQSGVDLTAREQIAAETERAEAAEQQLGSRIAENSSNIQGLQQDVEKIESYIPSTTSKENQLGDKAFINSSINNMAAFYIEYNAQGKAFPTRADLLNATTFYSGGKPRVPTQNDYAYVLSDESQPKDSLGNYPTTRYSYQGGTYPNGQWGFQYIVNNTSLTQAQVDAINSGITKGLVMQIGENKSGLAKEKTARENADASLQEQINLIGSAGVTSVNGKTGAVSVTAENIGAVDKSGDTMTGALKINNVDGESVNFDTSFYINNKAPNKNETVLGFWNDILKLGHPNYPAEFRSSQVSATNFEAQKIQANNAFLVGANTGTDTQGRIEVNNTYKCLNLLSPRPNGVAYDVQARTRGGDYTTFRAKQLYEATVRVYSPNNPPTKVAKVNNTYTYTQGLRSITAGTIYNLSTLCNNMTIKAEFIGGIVKVGSMVGYVINTTQFIALTNANLSSGTVIYFYYYTIG